MTHTEFVLACEKYRDFIRSTEGNPEERKRQINLFRAGLL